MSAIGNKKVFSENLNALMKSHGKDRKQVCEDLDLKYTTFTEWCNGKKYPRIDKIEMLANYFGVLKSDLIEDKADIPSNALSYNESYSAPIVGSIPAGYPAVALEDIEGYAPIPYKNEDDYFFLRVDGDSMINAGIKSGDLVLIRRQTFAAPGQIVACRIDGDEATLKRFKPQGNTVILMPENSAYDPTVVEAADFVRGEAGIIGVAIEVRHTL